MKNFTQKVLMVVLTVFVLVGMFYGLSTPVKASAANAPITSPQDQGGPAPLCVPDGSPCDLIPK